MTQMLSEAANSTQFMVNRT